MGELAALGLSDVEEAVYRTLIDVGPCEPAVLAAIRPGEPVGPALDRLRELGLTRVPAEAPGLLCATPPELALRRLMATAEADAAGLRLLVAQLLAEIGPATAQRNSVAEVVTGTDRVSRRAVEVQRSVRRELCALDKPPYTADPLENPAEVDLLRTGLSCRVVYERESLAIPGRLAHLESMAQLREEARVVTAVPLKLLLADAQLALIPLVGVTDTEQALVIRPSPLLDAVSALFEAVWRRAVPVQLAAAVEHAAIDADQRRLLALLATGADDDEIGRRLGLSARTLHRRVGALMAALGVSTRFQIGVAANRRGWS